MRRLSKDQISTALQVVGLIILFGFTAYKGNEEAKLKSLSTVSIDRDRDPVVELRTNMSQLWEEQVTWTRNIILCLVDDLPGEEQAVNQLEENHVEIGNAIKPYYGVDAGNKLSELLNKHNLIYTEVIKAAKSGETNLFEDANKRWYLNANEISGFFSKINPNWSLADMKQMMNKQLELTNDQMQQRIKKNYDADVIAFQKVHAEVLKMSFMLSDGIIKQFPEKFKTTTNGTASK